MITAEKLCIKCSHVNLSRRVDPRDIIEFAKFHVKEALKAASNTSLSPTYGLTKERDDVDKNRILNSYPLENIK